MIKRLTINLICAAIVITVLYAMVVGAQSAFEMVMNPLNQLSTPQN